MKVVRLGRTIAFYQVFFQQGSVTLGKCYIGLQNGHAPQDSRDGFFLYSARLLRRACSRSFWIISFEFVKVCGIRFSIWESFIGFYICCYPISTILACLFPVGVRISGKTLCWKGAWRRKCHLVSPTLYIIIVYRVSLNKLSRNFVGALRTTTTNWRVSFIYLYLVFPRNFKIVFLPHTNTLNLLEPVLWYYHRAWDTCDLFTATGHNINWDQFKILVSGKKDYLCKVKEILFIQEAAFNVNKLMLC